MRLAPRILIVVTLGLGAGCQRPSANSPSIASEAAWFEEVTEKLGLKCTHDCGPIAPDYFMPGLMGSGCAFLDFDGDGKLDICLIHNGGPTGAKNQLFHQEKDGTFRDVSAGSGLDVSGFGMGVAVGDVNNDGRPDVLLTEYGATRLFLNQGDGKFLEVTRAAGLDNPLWATSAAFCDFDRDGWLDLVVVNYLDYDRSVPCPGRGGRLDFCGPTTFAGSAARLYRNRGADDCVRFEDVTLKAGLGATRGKGLGVVCADFDGDGWPDIFVANDMMANHLWLNRGDGTFKEEAVLRGLAYTATGASSANMGIALADVDGDGLPDLFVTHLIDESHTLWKQGPRGLFGDRTGAAGLMKANRSTGFGTALVDFDRDGWPDLALVNGGVRRNQDAAESGPFWSRYAQRNQLHVNAGDGKFRDISPSNPALCTTPGVWRGLAVGDFDNDGAPDLLITQVGGPARLLRNIAPVKGHWLTVRATLPRQKRDAYGAEVTVRTGGKSYWRLLNPGHSYCSSSDPRLHFGLGSAERYDAIDVRWPDGRAETFPAGRADRQVELRQGDGAARPKSERK